MKIEEERGGKGMGREGREERRMEESFAQTIVHDYLSLNKTLCK